MRRPDPGWLLVCSAVSLGIAVCVLAVVKAVAGG